MLSVIPYRRWRFRVTDVARGFLKSVAFEWETYAQSPYGDGETRNTMWKLSKPLYGISTVCKDVYLALVDFLANDFGGASTSLGKSVFVWPQQNFSYDSGKGMCEMWRIAKKAGANFGTQSERNVPGAISLHVDDLLISGCGKFVGRNTQKRIGNTERKHLMGRIYLFMYAN